MHEPRQFGLSLMVGLSWGVPLTHLEQGYRGTILRMNGVGWSACLGHCPNQSGSGGRFYLLADPPVSLRFAMLRCFSLRLALPPGTSSKPCEDLRETVRIRSHPLCRALRPRESCVPGSHRCSSRSSNFTCLLRRWRREPQVAWGFSEPA